jgi:hypothetical protein
MKPMSFFRWSIMLLFVILFTQAASAALVDISAHFQEAAYIGQYEQLPGASQVATFSILEPSTVTITAEWSIWYPEIGFGRLGIVWKSPNDTWTEFPPFGEIISQVFTSNGRTIKQRDDAKHAPLKEVITYRVAKSNLPIDGYLVSMQRPAYYEGSFSQKAQDSHMIMDFTPDAGTGSGSGNTSGTGAIVGTWNWFTGTKVRMHPDGTLDGWDGNQKVNSGTWTGSGNKYTLNWVDGGYIDTLTLSADGQSLDGYNKGGTHVTGNKISSSDVDTGTGTPYAFSPSLSLERLVFAPGEEISVSFKAPASYADNAWVGIIPSSVAHGSEATNDQNDLTYQYLGKKTSGTLLFSAPQQNGSYDFRMNDNDANGKEVASVSFTVGKTAANTLTLARTSFRPGESITLQFSTSLTLPADAWIGIIPSSVPHGNEAVNDQHDVAYQYLQGKTSGSMTFTAPTVPGSYDFRMNDTDSNGLEIDAVPFTVALDASNTPTPVSDASLAGTWRIVANKTPGTLEFTRRGESWTGRLKFDVLGKWEELAKISYGPVSGEWRIQFLRPMGGFDQQMHTGALNGDKMKGTFTQANCVGDIYQWEATRVK